MSIAPAPHASVSAQPWLVLKFGGTSVSKRERWDTIGRLAAERAASEGARVLVVVSALSGVTNELQAIANGDDIAGRIAALVERHRGFCADELGIDPDAALGERLAALQALRDDPRAASRALDWQAEVLGQGELLSSSLGAAYLRAQGLDFGWCDARDWLDAVSLPNASEWAQRLSVNCRFEADAGLRARFAAQPARLLLTQGFIARHGDGGTAIAVRVDHSNEREVKALFRRILRAHKRIDIVVDSVAGEHPLMKQYGYLWQADLSKADEIFAQALTSRIITAKHAALAMMPAKRGLIVEVTENDMLGGGGNPMAQTVKVAQKILPLFWAAELAPHGITVIAITPGFLRSESMLEHFGVTEDNWRDGGKADANFLVSESPLFVGRAIAALAADRDILERTGMLLSSWELARHYRFTDYDGRRPDWGRLGIDFSVLPPPFVDFLRRGVSLETKWLATVLQRTKFFGAKIPRPRPSRGRG